MTGSYGDVDEMPTPPLDDRALDALLRGASAAPSGFDWLLPFVEELGQAASEPAPVVRPALALLLAQGPSGGGDDNGVIPAALPPTRTTRRAVRRVAGLGILAKVALGVGVAAASTTAAGAAGALPAPAQHAVASVVGAATPFTFPDRPAAAPVTKVPGRVGTPAEVATTITTTGAGAVKNNESGSRSGNSGPGNSGSSGRDRDNETPTTGNVPTSVPVTTKPDDGGSQGSSGKGSTGTTATTAKPNGSGSQGSSGRGNGTTSTTKLEAEGNRGPGHS